MRCLLIKGGLCPHLLKSANNRAQASNVVVQ